MNKTSDPGLIEAKTRNENASAALREFKLAVLKQEYVAVKDVNKEWAEDINKVRTKLLGLSARITPQLAGQELDGEEIKRIIDAVIYEALSELASTYKEP